MRYARNGDWTEWMRAERVCMDEHVKYRVTHYSKLCHVTQNIVYHLWLDVDLYNNQVKPAEEYYANSMGYGISCEYARNQAYHFMEEEAFDSLQVKLILEDPFENEEPEIIQFPTYIIDED
ncbi:MAG: hypothetical protein HKO93_01070 [Flavobacteriales bacterium]|nr:hypothetical protein [Flavobacteriales bacterium]